MSIIGEITSTNLQAIKNWIEKNNPTDFARAPQFVSEIDSVDFDTDDLNIGADTISYVDKETGYNYNFTIVDGEIKTSTGEVIGKVDTPKTEATSSRDYSSMSSAQIQAEIDALTKQKEANTESLEKLEKQIAQLEKQIKDATNAAIDAKDDLVAGQKELAKTAVAEALDAYTKGDLETPEEFQAAVRNKLTEGGLFSTEQSQIITNLLIADQNMALLDNSLGKMRSFINANDAIDVELSALNNALTTALANEAAAAAASTSCDPIAFEMGDLTYTFMVDHDGNGELTDASEFLGSSDYWSAMQALDMDGDNQVSAYEMEQGGIKIVKTDAEGKQSIASASEIFNSDGDYVDLSSYDSKGTFEGLEEGQTLLGTFNVVLDGENEEAGEYGGYSTLDTEEYLNENYEFSAGTAMASTVATQFQYEEDTQSTQGEFKKFWNEHMELMAELDKNLKLAYIETGLSSTTDATTMENVRKMSKTLAAKGVESEQMVVVEEVPEEENEEIEIEDLKDESGKVSFEKLEVGDVLVGEYEKELESLKAETQPQESENQTIYDDGRFIITVDEDGKIVKKEDKLES